MTEREIFDLQNNAIDLINDESYDEAIAILLEVAKTLSKTERVFERQAVWYLLGKGYACIDEYEKALEYYKISAETELYSGDAYAEMGVILKEKGEFIRAAEHYKKALMEQYHHGEEVFNNLSSTEIWHYLAVSLMLAFNEGDTDDVHEILRYLREALLLEPQYFNAYKNCSVCFAVLGEKKRSKEFLEIYDKKKIDDKQYVKLIFDLSAFSRDDNSPDYHFKINITDNTENYHCEPTFNKIKASLTQLWQDCQSQRRLTLYTAFGDTDNLLSVTIEQDLETQRPIASMETQLACKVNGECTLATLCYDVAILAELLQAFEAYFCDRMLYKKENWRLEVEVKADRIARRMKAIEPTIIAPIRQQTEIPYCEIMLSEEPCSRTTSMVGGAPYMPEGFAYPVSANGIPLRLLAQINFAEMPPLPDFPTTGILQFFILENDDDEGSMYGMDFDDLTTQNSFRVLYHEIVDKAATQQAIPADCYNVDYALLAPDECLRMSFVKDNMMMNLDDFRFEKIFSKCYKAESIYDVDSTTRDVLYEVFYKTGHRVSGYPYFTQTDPRDEDLYADKEVLLLQLDSENVGDVSLMWGDCGVANFFISREDLKNRNFENVLYTWDCG